MAAAPFLAAAPFVAAAPLDLDPAFPALPFVPPPTGPGGGFFPLVPPAFDPDLAAPPGGTGFAKVGGAAGTGLPFAFGAPPSPTGTCAFLGAVFGFDGLPTGDAAFGLDPAILFGFATAPCLSKGGTAR